MKNVRPIAERYAQALSRAIAGDAEFSRVRDDLSSLARLVDASVDLRRALAHPAISPDAKLNVLKELGRRLQAQRETIQLLETLASHERLTMLREVAEAAGRIADRRLGVTEVEIRSAAPLDAAVRSQLRAILEKMTRGKIKTREVTDAGLLGGVVLRVGGTVFDGSVKSKLERLRQRLTGRTTAVARS